MQFVLHKNIVAFDVMPIVFHSLVPSGDIKQFLLHPFSAVSRFD